MDAQGYDPERRVWHAYHIFLACYHCTISPLDGDLIDWYSYYNQIVLNSLMLAEELKKAICTLIESIKLFKRRLL